jgi:hexosaminidase
VILPLLFAAVAASLPVIPKPVSVDLPPGVAPFALVGTTQIKDDRKLFASQLLQEIIAKGAHVKLGRTNSLRLPGIDFEPEAGPKESYSLHVDSKGIRIGYSDPAGALYAVESLRQLLPAEIESSKGTSKTIGIPAVDIHDAPRFPWRGMHLDVSRHFFPAPFIKRYIDYIAMMKMNVFHWHLVDDGGWRLQIDKYPKLTSVGAWRYGVTTDWDQGRLRFDPESKLPKYGGFYTKAEVRDIVKYAADRNVTVVPEIEMPGHAMPVFAAYPEIGCLNQPPAAQAGQLATDVYCAGSDQTYQFVEDVLTEVMELFPSKWIHIGGDEVWKGYWQKCPRCQAKIKAEGLKNEEELQSYFVRRIDKFLADHGRRLIGWDEILEGGLAQGATVMSWRGIEGGIAAAKAGHDVVMSPTSHAYFDAPYSSQPTEHVLTFDPVPGELNAEEAKHVLGGQANVWCEWIPTEARVEYMIWPRMAAMAEVLWSPKETDRDATEFAGRISTLINRLDMAGVNYYIPAPHVPVTAIIFSDYAKVEATKDPSMPAALRYSYGSNPVNSSSQAYASPITIIGDGQSVNFAYVSSNGRVGDVTTVTAKRAETIDLPNPVAGWKVDAFEGKWSRVPDFSKFTPLKSGTAASVGLEPKTRDENFALHFEGYLLIDRPGVYNFGLSSDDGSWLKVAGAMVVDNDGAHPAVLKDGSVALPKGWHRIEIGYFQGAGGLSLKATMERKPLDGLVFRAAAASK